jgi:anti-sigma regulatory factor (Ser/Thr protein kinase)
LHGLPAADPFADRDRACSRIGPRVCVRATLHAWHEDALVQDAELIVSELTGNAVAASADADGRPVYVDGRIPVIRVCLLTDGVRLLMEVWDQAPGIPVLREATGDEESGRGLMLVNAISDKWGWDPAEGQSGKVVRAAAARELGTHAPPGRQCRDGS